MQKPNLLTSCARNDAALGRFVGFLTTLLLLASCNALCEWIASPPRNPLSVIWSAPLSLLLMAVVGASIFFVLRRRVPDFARGYRAGCLITAGVLIPAAILLPTFL